MSVLGKIKTLKAYQTTDGAKFTGPTAKERAEEHQVKLNAAELWFKESNVPQVIKDVVLNTNGKTTPIALLHKGLLTVEIDFEQSSVNLLYSGNMGASIRNVNKELKSLVSGYTVKKLRKLAQNYTESGSPDYFWKAVYYF